MLTRHTYIQTTEVYLSYKLTTEPKGSGELINWIKFANIVKYSVRVYRVYRYLPDASIPCVPTSSAKNCNYIIRMLLKIINTLCDFSGPCSFSGKVVLPNNSFSCV